MAVAMLTPLPGAGGPAEERLDPGHQRPRAEGFADIIVGAETKAEELVDLFGPAGQER